MTRLHRLREWLLCGFLSRGHLWHPSSIGSSCLRCGRVLVRMSPSPARASWSTLKGDERRIAKLRAVEASQAAWVLASDVSTSPSPKARATESASAAKRRASR